MNNLHDITASWLCKVEPFNYGIPCNLLINEVLLLWEFYIECFYCTSKILPGANGKKTYVHLENVIEKLKTKDYHYQNKHSCWCMHQNNLRLINIVLLQKSCTLLSQSAQYPKLKAITLNSGIDL